MNKQTGLAIINALVIVFATSLIAVELIKRYSQYTEQLIANQDRTQAVQLLQGGLDWASLLLQLDNRQQQITSSSGLLLQRIERFKIDSLDGSESAFFSGYIEDEQGKFNLLRLAHKQQIDELEVAALEQLLQELNLPKQLAQQFALQLANAQSTEQQLPTTLPARTASELFAASQLSLAQKQLLDSYCSILPRSSALNINNASALVLVSSVHNLSLTNALQITRQRDLGNYFNDQNSFLKQLPNDSQVHQNLKLTGKSRYFKAFGLIEKGQTRVQQQALLERKNDQVFTLWRQ